MGKKIIADPKLDGREAYLQAFCVCVHVATRLLILREEKFNFAPMLHTRNIIFDNSFLRGMTLACMLKLRPRQHKSHMQFVSNVTGRANIHLFFKDCRGSPPKVLF